MNRMFSSVGGNAEVAAERGSVWSADDSIGTEFAQGTRA
jgi:hypothetical protein